MTSLVSIHNPESIITNSGENCPPEAKSSSIPDESMNTHYASEDNSAQMSINGFEQDCDLNLVTPTKAMVCKIIKQCEFYFSDANILKDPFLLKKTKLVKDGWVPLSLIERFSKMAALSDDHNIFVYALKQSKILEVSEDGNFCLFNFLGLSIRRVEPIPEWDRSVYYRSIIIANIPEDVLTIEEITMLFTTSVFKPKLVRIVAPSRRVPADLQCSRYFHKIIGSEPCAVIEFESNQHAIDAKDFIKTRFSGCYSKMLSFNNKFPPKPKPQSIEKPTSEIKLRPAGVLRSAISAVNSAARVELLREPLGPTNEDALGFKLNWRLLIRLDPLLPPDSDESLDQFPSDPAINLMTDVESISDTPLLALDSAIVSAQIVSS